MFYLVCLIAAHTASTLRFDEIGPLMGNNIWLNGDCIWLVDLIFFFINFPRFGSGFELSSTITLVLQKKRQNNEFANR